MRWHGVESSGLVKLADDMDGILGELTAVDGDGRGQEDCALPFGMTEATAGLGLSRYRVAQTAEEAGVPVRGMRPVRFSLQQMNALRDRAGKRPGRGAARPARVAVQSFKGGVGKSTLAVHLGQFLAREGYRVLLVDCDPQASATSSFGHVPDLDFTEDDTLVPFVLGQHDSLAYAIRPTAFEGLDLIPACVALQSVDLDLFRMTLTTEAEDVAAVYGLLATGIETVEDGYDVVVLDSAPALSMMSVGIMLAATGLVVPLPPASYDLASTSQYLRMAADVRGGLGGGTGYDFVRLVPSRVDRSKRGQVATLDLMRDRLGGFVATAPMFVSGAIPERAARHGTLLSGRSPPDRRVSAWLFEALGEIEREIAGSWERAHG